MKHLWLSVKIETIARGCGDILDINEPFGQKLMVWEVIYVKYYQ